MEFKEEIERAKALRKELEAQGFDNPSLMEVLNFQALNDVRTDIRRELSDIRGDLSDIRGTLKGLVFGLSLGLGVGFSVVIGLLVSILTLVS